MRTISCGIATLVLLALVACNQTRSPQEIRQKTAEATTEAKQDAQALAQGVREGWNRDQELNLNTATRSELVGLPGITGAEADRVIAGRPYGEPGDLVSRHIVSKAEYDRIADRVTAK
jgi:DNA uptake protein ComE-like DNA-binding protein